ncbi:uncharacterized protein BDW47DRAFT_134535 [Aspergillus candidus]|uniref:Uncharacterized protein n=1 Tax=Aspergillus candidus TaxID=41067 RepID=A0A2I2FJ89_ASPCN|nr:hypothetical protein BDW47DRAFT_134535 [Aspergillus candidus]PLB40689.1 hypothetical protein BDW47DRAFT_134535 [Aspergillus candidus]
MCKYTYHHYVQCGHIATFTVDSCWNLVEQLRQGPTQVTNCLNIERHDLLPQDQPYMCNQCRPAYLERIREKQFKSMRRSSETSDTCSSSPAFTQLERLGDSFITITADFKMTVEQEGRTVYLPPAPESRQPEAKASPGELPGSDNRPRSPPSAFTFFEVPKYEPRAEQNSPAAPVPIPVSADDDVSDIWLEISQPREGSGFYDSDSDDTYPDLGEVTDSEEEGEEHPEEKPQEEKAKTGEKKSFFGPAFIPFKSTLASPKPTFRSAADPVLDIVSDDPRVKEPWYPFCNTPSKNEPVPRTFLQSPTPRRTRISHILDPSEYDDDVKSLSVGTGFQSERLRRVTNGSVKTPKKRVGGRKVLDHIWGGAGLFGSGMQGLAVAFLCFSSTFYTQINKMQSPNPSPSNVRSPAEDPSSNTFFDVPLSESPLEASPSGPDRTTDPDDDDDHYDWIEAQHAQQPLHEEEGVLVKETEIEVAEYIFGNDDYDDDDSLPGYNSPIEDMPIPIVDMDAHASDLRDALIEDRLPEVEDNLDDGVWMVWLLGEERREFFLDVYLGEWI